LPSEPQDVLDAVRSVAAGPIAAQAAQVDRERRFPTDGIAALAAVGGLGIVVPKEQGGAGGGLLALAEACEAVGSACASTGMVYLMHAVTAATIAGGGGEMASGYLEGLASGRVVGTLAFSERGTGAHFYAPELQAVQSNGGVRISGRKSFVTSGGYADVYLVLVQSGTGEGLDCFLVEREAQGMRFDGQWQGLGMAGNSSIALELEDVAVDASARIGASGSGADLVFSVVAPFFLVGLASVNVGIASGTLKAASEHAANRRYGDGSLLAEVQGIQHLLADMDIAVRASRLLVHEAARLGDAGDEGALVPIMEAKVSATDMAAEVTQRALEVCGGQGYTPALPIERWLRDARAGAVMAPTNAVLRNWIGKALTGLPVP
jgi:alkylation response protein AidB-like acyl-CoA dehydrogenase